ncbi:MAG: MFS transporter [Sphaerobacteraceae bacterium]|nr:MAG: MFS transporter [Sphaerobacteraceae bacterium]
MNQERQQERSLLPLIPLGLAAFAGFLNLFGMNPFFISIADDIGTSVSMVGYTSTIALVVTGVAGLIVGPISERVGIRRILIAGLILASGGAIATAMAINTETLVLARALAGIGGSITGGVTVSAAAILYAGRQRQRALAIISASAAMAVVIGVFLMTLMAEPFGWRGAYIILGGALLVIGLLNRILLVPDQQAPSRESFKRIRQLFRPYRPLLGDRSLRRLFAGATFHPAALNGMTAYAGAFLISQHGTSTQFVGLMFSVVGITYFVGNLIAAQLGRAPQHMVFSIGVLLMGGFWLAGYVVPVPPFAITALFGMATFAAGIAWVTLLNSVADRAGENVGTAMVFSASLMSFGGALGIGLSAGLLDISGYAGVAIGMSVLATIGAIAGWVGPPTGAEAPEQSKTPSYERATELS